MSTPEPKRGRPRRPARPVSIHVKVAATTYDAVFRQAAREDVTVPELLRRAVADRLVAGDK